MLPSTADIVIIGGGVMGASAAYHLTKRGLRNVVLLERESFFGQGSTGRCAGGIRHQFSTDVNIDLSIQSLAMLYNFEQETGQPIDVRKLGYLFLLSTEEEMAQFERNVEKQHLHNIPSEVWTVDEIARRVPLLNLDGIIGGTYCAQDGIADPSGVVNGYLAGARALGATLLNDVNVIGIEASGERIEAVLTNQGRIATHIVINAAGA